jgi:hypothetical protein
MKNDGRAAIVVTVLLAALTLLGIECALAQVMPQQHVHAQEIAQAATPAPPSSYVVTGSVVLKGGASVTGGTAGSVLAMDAAFKASSPSGSVTEMRAATRYGGGCLKDMSSVAWEPFAPTQTFTLTIGLNFIGFYVSAQFRDANGNLSPIVCDDISVEGMPVRPTTLSASATPAPNVAPTVAPAAAPRANAPGLCGSGAIALFVVGLCFVLLRR